MTKTTSRMVNVGYLIVVWGLTQGCSSSSNVEPAPVRQVASALLEQAREYLGKDSGAAFSALCNTSGQSARPPGDGERYVHRCLNTQRFLDIEPWLMGFQVRAERVELMSLTAVVAEKGMAADTLIAALYSQLETQCDERQEQDGEQVLLSGCSGGFAVAVVYTQRLATPEARVTVVLATTKPALDFYWGQQGRQGMP